MGSRPHLLALLSALAALAALGGARAARSDAAILLDVKRGLDPRGEVLASWVAGKDPCGAEDGFVGVACDSRGRVTNVSLQGRGLEGSIPAAIGELSSLTALYLHYNSLSGSIPSSLASLTGLTDVYLNVNKLSGAIPSQLTSLRNLQALQLCCNDLSGPIPDALGHLGLLNLLALQHNHLDGRIPASLGQLSSLKHLDLSFNSLSGPIPAALNNLAQITVLDVRSNKLSGYVPAGLRSLETGFAYSNNTGLCGVGFPSLPYCSGSGASSLQRPQPFGAVAPEHAATGPSTATNPRARGHIPNLVEPQAKPGNAATVAQTVAKRAPLSTNSSSRIPQMAVIGGVVAVTGGVLLAMLMSFVWFRRHKQRISSTHDSSGGIKVAIMDILSPEQTKSKSGGDGGGKGSSLHLVAPLAMQSINAPKSLVGSSMRSFQYRLEELEVATNYFSDKYLLARKSSLSIYRAVVRDGSTAVIKYFTKTRFVGGEEEFEAALSSFVQLKHDNLVKLKGFCCVQGGLQCYLVYDFVPNGSLFEHLHGPSVSPLDWGTRVQIAHGVAKGLDYLHRNGEQVIVWASNVLLDESYNALVSSWGHNKVLADELVYANIKTSAMLGYLAPEYGVIGHLHEKSDVYAFGILLLELLTGRKPMYADGSSLSVTNLANFVRPLFDSGHLDTAIDPSLGTKFSATGAIGMASIAFSCVAPVPQLRPSMGQVVQRLYEIETLADGAGASATADAGFSSSGEECTSYPTRQQAAYAEMLDYGR
ncbi:LRR receptor kinase SERK2 [Selaginella moellendorffii]|uniref:LRR receptor kinase SERK2 n=1 Tax=Selaginella moellendorffii TaxID=88036 RepID=UPI000D1CE825|nr:LRR receptor kinase SERK2 [Selaginella moellendorffii]|eukprot:XP_024515171.1 LRR receptor kinase SERK2 [Selaginella moellendorffii]